MNKQYDNATERNPFSCRSVVDDSKSSSRSICDSNFINSREKSNSHSRRSSSSSSEEEELNPSEVLGLKQKRKSLIKQVLMSFSNQIAGHGSEGGKGFLKHVGGKLLKPLQKPPNGTRELEFYKALNSATADETDKAIKGCVPEFFGTDTVGIIEGLSASDEYIVLQDVTEGMELPNVMDIKIGSKTYGPDATEKKREREDSKYPGTKYPYGFSILGIIVHSIKAVEGKTDEETKIRYDRNFGMTLAESEVMKCPRTYFDVERNDGKLVRPLVAAFIELLEEVLEVFEAQRNYFIFASSLLFAYDAKKVRAFIENESQFATEEEKVRELKTNVVNLKLIDFAHTHPNPDKVQDENFVRGLRNLTKLLKDFLSQQQ